MAATDRRSGAAVVTRPSLGRAVMLAVLTWGAAAAFVLMVAADTRMGPVVFRLTATHGVHLGDIYATLACVIVAMLITVWIAVDHMGRKRRWVKAQRRAERERQMAAAEVEYADGEYDDGYADQYDHQYDDEYVEGDYEYGYEDDAAYVEQHDADPEPRRGRHEADPDLVDTVFIRRPTDHDGRHRQRH
jgi:uncharacterized membrane protein